MTASADTAKVASLENSVMEGNSTPKFMPPGRGMMLPMPGPQLSEHQEKMHSQTDSFLTAARLVRGGWLEGERKTWQFSHVDFSVHKPNSDKNNRAKIYLKDTRTRTRPVPVMNRGQMTEETEMGTEEETDEAKQRCEGAFSTNKQAGRQTGGVRVWASHCRIISRKSRCFKAPILPAITEI